MYYTNTKALKIALKITLVTLCFALTITSCSRKKDSFINRNFHAVTAEYNTLFNGFNALEQGRNSLNSSYFDNYWEILPVERMQVTDEIILPGQSKNADFTRAEEKAVKAIQKHGMNIQGKEYNPQIDEAYLLLGQARYFDQRFVPALNAFNKILSSYAASDKINTAKVWREKTNMRLDNNEIAIENLKRLLDQEELEDQQLADATSTLAQAYINLEQLDTAIVHIKTASKATKKNEEKGRFNFIKGQLYNALKYKDSANMAFDQVIDLNRKIPRQYLIAAEVEKAKNFDYENGNKIEFLEHLTKLEKNRENRPFLDKIYHQIAQFHLENKFDSLAIAYYNKSLRTNSQDKILVAKNYQTLGDYYFDDAQYKLAGAYYDSTLTNMVENSKPYRTIKKKNDNLEDVILYEGIADANDSILRLVAMPKSEQLSYFTTYTNGLKEEALAEQERLEIAQRKKGLEQTTNTTNKGFGPPSVSNPRATSSFYFYNPSTVAYGKNEFEQLWGERENKDNWRWSNSGRGNFSAQNSTTSVVENATEDQKYNPQYYIDQLPQTDKEIDSLIKDRNYAYYQLGLIYKEKFKEYQLAKQKFTTLLKSEPEERLVLPSKYNLYKIYEILGETNASEIAKQDIIENHADSRYAFILQNPNQAVADNQDSPENLYKQTYLLLEKQQFEKVISNSDTYLNYFDGDPIQPKFELLKATAKGRLYGYQTYVDGLNQIALDYANTEEGKQAQALVNSLQTLGDSSFKSNDISKSFKVVYQFDTTNKDQITEFKKQLDSAITKISYYDLATSVDVYNTDKTFVVVHGIKSIDGAKGFAQIINEEKQKSKKITKPFFAISQDNYQTVQIHKNLDTYLASQ